MMAAMTTQLRLIETNEVEWRLDEHVKEVGRRGLARARAALVAARPLRPQPLAEQRSSAA
jgi:hypothetical protein